MRRTPNMGVDEQRKRALEVLDNILVRRWLDDKERSADQVAPSVRYALSFARLTKVRNRHHEDIDLTEHLAMHSEWVLDQLTPRIEGSRRVGELASLVPELIRRTITARDEVLRTADIDRDSLEQEVTQRHLVVVSGGGGGAGYVYPGAYEAFERLGQIPDLMVGTSIGALLSMFRCRRKRWDMAPMVSASRSLSWSGVFKVLETESRYGLPATLRMHLRAALGHLFRHPSGRPLWLSDMPIPLLMVTTGIKVGALRHDLHHYEHLMDGTVRQPAGRWALGGGARLFKTVGEFLSRRDSLVQVVLGQDPGTEDFDVLDGAGFSSAIPGLLHYDVLRDDQRMRRMLDRLHDRYGITRLSEGGLTSNLPARVAWEAVQAGKIGRRNGLVVALDCFAANPRRPVWYPLQTLLRLSNTEADRAFADAVVTFPKTLSPVNLVPTMEEALKAIRWGRAAMDPHLAFIERSLQTVPVLKEP